MKNVILAAAATLTLAATATTASAFELGNSGVHVDNEVTLGYEVENDAMYGQYEMDVYKSWGDFTAFSELDVLYLNANDSEFDMYEVKAGVKYQVNEVFDVRTYGAYDNVLEDTRLHVEAVAKF